ncbi:NUDIX domain-containing protein [Qipengyuania sp. ASV99]|uniref:NUDIX domain-containing protein n=1 Tax=Qipengyuania sp. ASV99 TaxID=3399681 RepID=UPI003A4C8200
MTIGAAGEPMWVVAGALRASEDTWLMHRRPLEKEHGGLWEFPGGKVEPAEIPVKALIRELHEELGIVVAETHCRPAGFAQEDPQQFVGKKRGPIVILLYTITAWQGEPRAIEGGRIGWFTAQEIVSLAKPPLDRELARSLFGG